MRKIQWLVLAFVCFAIAGCHDQRPEDFPISLSGPKTVTLLHNDGPFITVYAQFRQDIKTRDVDFQWSDDASALERADESLEFHSGNPLRYSETVATPDGYAFSKGVKCDWFLLIPAGAKGGMKLFLRMSVDFNGTTLHSNIIAIDVIDADQR